jgi:hypothetical protein
LLQHLHIVSNSPKTRHRADKGADHSVCRPRRGGKPEFATLDASTKLLYQNLQDADSVVAIDIAKRAVVQRWPLQGCKAPTGMAFDDIHRRLFIGCGANAVLAVFDLSERRVVATIPIGKAPDSVAFDPGLHRIYTTGKSGVLVVIQQDEPSKYKILDTVHLHYGAHGYFGFANWLPTLLVSQGVEISKSLAYSAVLALVPPIAPFVFSFFVDQI